MKRSYLIFCGFAVAYCMNVMVALQIQNASTLPSAVFKPAISQSFSDRRNSIGEYKKHTEKKKTVCDYSKSYYSGVEYCEEIRTSRERYFNFPNASFELSSATLYNPTHKNLSFIRSCKLHISFESIDPLYVDGQPSGSGKYSSEDSKNLADYNAVIEFSG